jgi:hypothetical protein
LGKAAKAKARAPATGPRGAAPGFGTVDFPLKRHLSPHGQVTAVSMMKDEGPYVLEWVAHHLAVGFSDLVVYTNDCSDGTDDMLIRLEALGLCHHRRNVIPEGIRPQPSALNHAQDEPVVQGSDWVMVFDADEFLSIRYGDGTLDDLLAAVKAQGANGIVVTWRIFGSGGVVDWSRAPVTEQYLMAAPVTWNKGWGVKTLFTFDADYWKLGIHRPKMKTRHIKTDFPDRVKWLTGSGAVMEDYFKFRGWRSITRTVGYDWVQLNHYAVKSVESYALRKLRGNVNNKADKYNSGYWSLQDRNEVRDDTMLRYTEKRNDIMAMLLTDPELSRLHFAALDRVEARLAELRGTEAYQALVADLARASTVPISEIVAKPPQARDKEKIAALMSDVEKLRSAKAKAARKAEGPATPVETVPLTSYLDSPRLSEGGVDWVANHGILLPLDSGFFPPSILPVMQAGKFERGLARRMPQVLPKGATVLEIGGAVGFLALHLSRVRPDLRLVVTEHEQTFTMMMQRIMARNGMEFGDRLRHLPDVTAALDLRPKVLMISDPDADLARLIEGLAEIPEQLFIFGRSLQRHQAAIPVVSEALAARGLLPAAGFDPNICHAFAKGGQAAAVPALSPKKTQKGP